jgi:serine/threonine-protein kinase
MPEIGKYHLIAELARGGMGVVYLAVARGPAGFNKLLVVKELKPEMANDVDFVDMFLDEARIAARLTHPNIVQTNEVGSIGQRHFIVMEFLDGRTLHRIGRRLTQRGGFPINAHLRIIGDALLGLHYAHNLKDFDGQTLGLVHRDVSPHNVFVTFDGQTKLLDFGIAKANDSSNETKTGVLKGRIAYMSPEQMGGETADCRADVYAAGVMIWEAVAKRRLWNGKTDVEVLTHMLREDPPRLRSIAPETPAALDALCARAMARNRDERYPTAAALHDDLESYLVSTGDVPTMRQIGLLVTQAFAEDRVKMSTTIEEALSRLRGGGRAAILPTVSVNASTPPGSGSNSTPSGHTPDEMSHASTQLVLTPDSMRPGMLRGSATSQAHTGGTNTGKTVLERWGAGRLALGFGAVVAALIVLVVVTAGRVGQEGGAEQGRAGHGPTEPTTAPLVEMENPVPPGAPASTLVDIEVRATPSTARISIDGTAASGNPYRGRYPRDGKPHRIDVSADGYDTKSEQVTFTQNLAVDLNLERKLAAASPRYYYVPVSRPTKNSQSSDPPATTVATSPPQPPAPVEVNPAGGRQPLRPIDPSNPYSGN